jgi:hypothetical protein
MLDPWGLQGIRTERTVLNRLPIDVTRADAGVRLGAGRRRNESSNSHGSEKLYGLG